jgi:hypothetical protein
MHFNKIKKKQDVWEELRKETNRPVDERKKKMVNCPMGENEEKKKQWNRKS